MNLDTEMDYSLPNGLGEANTAHINKSQFDCENFKNTNIPLNAELLKLDKSGVLIVPQQQNLQFAYSNNANCNANGISNNLPTQQQELQKSTIGNVNSTTKKKSNIGNEVRHKELNNNAKRPRVVKNTKTNAVQLSSALSNNRYALLDLEVNTVLTNTSETADNTRKDSRTRDDTNIDSSSTEDETETRNRPAGIDELAHQQRFLPPIVMFDVNIRAFVLELKAKVPNLIFKIKNCSTRKSKLFVKDYSAYSRIMTILKEKGINSHSYTPAQDKQISLILRGIHSTTSADEIKADLDVLTPDTVDSVHTFLTAHMKRNNIKSNLFRITLKPGCDSKDITSIKYILYQSISWEKPKTFNKQLQCKKCQKWGHIAKNCNHPYHCVKCDAAHGPGECSLKKSEDTKPFCVNCKQWGHPANFRGCEAYKAFADLRSIRNNTLSPNLNTRSKNNNILISNSASTPKSTYIKPGVSYSSHFKLPNRSMNNKFQNAKLIEDFIQLAKQLLEEEEPLPLESQIENFLKNFRSMPLDTRKAECRKLLEQLK